MAGTIAANQCIKDYYMRMSKTIVILNKLLYNIQSFRQKILLLKLLYL